MDVFERTVAGDLPDSLVCEMLSYAFCVVMSLIHSRDYRSQLLRTLVRLYRALSTPDYVQMCQCLIFLDEPSSVADVLEKLSAGSPADALMAYQIAFDMYESATQQFLSRVLAAIRKTAPAITTISMNTEGEKVEANEEALKDVVKLTEKEKQSKIEKLASILAGEKPLYLKIQFFIRNDHTDHLILQQTKDAVRVSICHTANVIANGLMHSGINTHEKESLNLMQSFLPMDTSGTISGYAEGGGLYALGLIHANHGGDITEYLLGQVKDAGSEQIKHGGCLGLGLAAIGTHRADVYEQLKLCLYQDGAVAGEAAGLAMGLCELGSKSASAIEDMVAYAHKTQHEKILRSLAVGISLVMYGRSEEADPLIESLIRDKDHILRRSGMYTIAMAYCGTGNNSAIRKLLQVAVSDVNDDVRRAAVIGLGKLY